MDGRKLIYDIGMHQGEDTDYYLRLGYHVIGIEADPNLAELCRIRFRDSLATGRLKIVEGAIAPESAGATIRFFRSDSTVWGTTDAAWVERNIKKGAQATLLEVQRVDMRQVYAAFGIPHYMKIDIEGGDLYVVETLLEAPSKPAFISIESDKIDLKNIEAEIRALLELGYKKFAAVQQDTIPNSIVLTRTLDGRLYPHTFEPCSSGPFGNALPQPWKSADEILEEYAFIFEMYRRFGDRSGFLDLPQAEQEKLAAEWKATTGYEGPLPGWFDTHASL